MEIRGKVWKFGDDVSAQDITAPRYFQYAKNLKEIVHHIFETLDPDFVAQASAGDIVVAGKNFGYGNAPESTPQALKVFGVSAVIAESFGRMFFRNGMNIGLPLIELPRINEFVNSGDIISIGLAKGSLKNESTGKVMTFQALPDFMLRILESGGLVQTVKQRKF